MKRMIATVLSLGALAVSSAAPVVAANVTTSSNETVTVTAASVDNVSISGSAALTLTLSGAAGSTAVAGSDASSRLNYSHNSASNKKVTAEVTATTFPSGITGDDITLKVTVGGGAGQKTLISAGTNASAQDVYTGIGKGAVADATVTYDVSATTSGTAAGAYVFTIAYTSI